MSVKAYLGDGVYVDHDHYHVVLTTEDGISVTNTIYLEPPVLEAFLVYVTGLKETSDTEEATQ